MGTSTNGTREPGDRQGRISRPTVRRLSLYLRHLEDIAQQGRTTTSSRKLADALGLTDAQVRKDLASFGQFGQPGVGYQVDRLIARLREIFGTEEVSDVVLVGVGSIGRALLGFKGFLHKGFRFVAAFDAAAAKIGRKIGGIPVQPMEELAGTVRSKRIRLAVLAVPAPAAQEVADALCEAGIRGILNFAPIRLEVPEGIVVIPVDLAAMLQQLNYFTGGGPAIRKQAPADQS